MRWLCACVYVCARNVRSRSRARGYGNSVDWRAGWGRRWLKSFRARHKCSDIGPWQQFACRQQRMCRQTPSLSLIEGPLRGTTQYADRVDALVVIFVVRWPLFLLLYEYYDCVSVFFIIHNIILCASEREMFAKVQWNDYVTRPTIILISTPCR